MGLKSVLGTTCGLALATWATAQPPTVGGQPTPGANLPYPVSLYQMPDVGKSINLTQDQIGKLNAVTNQLQTRYRDDYTKLMTVPEADRPNRLLELNQKYSADWDKASRDVFNDTQRTRYQQLNYQYGGFNNFYAPDVQTRLNLTPTQIKNLNEQVTWSNQQLDAINRTGATDPAKATQLYRDYWTQRDDRFVKYLTPQQQKTWREMTGDPYTFQPVFPRR